MIMPTLPKEVKNRLLGSRADVSVFSHQSDQVNLADFATTSPFWLMAKAVL